MVATLQEELLAPVGEGFLDLLLILLDAGDVGLFVPGPAVEVAELAVGDTDVGGIAVAVDDPGDRLLRHRLEAELVGDVHQFGGGGVFEQPDAFFGGEPVAVESSLE